MLPKMSAYRRDFDETKDMSFLIKSDELLEKYNKNWDKVRYKKGFDTEPVYNGKYIKTKIKSYEEKINTNFQGTKIRFSIHLPLSNFD